MSQPFRAAYLLVIVKQPLVPDKAGAGKNQHSIGDALALASDATLLLTAPLRSMMAVGGT
jgi:hypothetical protein